MHDFQAAPEIPRLFGQDACLGVFISESQFSAFQLLPNVPFSRSPVRLPDFSTAFTSKANSKQSVSHLVIWIACGRRLLMNY
ncbi:MAG: hypothetical protein WCS43_15250 [Verrucomicrobiota bacterium]